jgi:hypothetical protein
MELAAMQRRFLISMGIWVAASSLAMAAGADYNGDGKISKEEFRNQAARQAFDADKNKNGSIDEDEAPLSADQRKRLDTNGDGKVSVEEYQVGLVGGFNDIDKNHDGFLDSSEMKGG